MSRYMCRKSRPPEHGMLDGPGTVMGCRTSHLDEESLDSTCPFILYSCEFRGRPRDDGS